MKKKVLSFKVLFVTSEHPDQMFGGLGTFTREYTNALRKKCDVKVVYFHFYPTPPLKKACILV